MLVGPCSAYSVTLMYLCFTRTRYRILLIYIACLSLATAWQQTDSIEVQYPHQYFTFSLVMTLYCKLTQACQTTYPFPVC